MSAPQAKRAPSLNLPLSDSICRVSILDAQCDITAPPHYLVQPPIEGHEWMNLPTYAFYIVHEKTGKEIIFDLGSKKDWQNSVPNIANLLAIHVPGLRVGNGVVDILRDGGVDPDKLNVFILSHWHFDHCGDPAILPKACDMVVGPGFKERFYPGYPTTPDSVFWESAFEGRNLIELDFAAPLKIGGFRAHDFFNDGSLYLLDSPGHTTGHISALVRTTPDTFVLLAGDVCHFTGMIRPSKYIPLPDALPNETVLSSHLPQPCPCTAFLGIHPDQPNFRSTPFYHVSTHEQSFYDDEKSATESINHLAAFDADPNILIIIAHDPAPKEVLHFFPKSTINDWKNRGYKAKMHWSFFSELPYEGKTHRGTLVDGLYDDTGKKVRGLKGKEA